MKIINKIEENKMSDVSDGNHTFRELYQHRTFLFSMVCKAFKEKSWIAFQHEDGSMFDKMFLAGISTPKGDYCYHCELKYLNYFEGVKQLHKAPHYDGHKPEDFERLLSIL